MSKSHLTTTRHQVDGADINVGLLSRKKNEGIRACLADFASPLVGSWQISNDCRERNL